MIFIVIGEKSLLHSFTCSSGAVLDVMGARRGYRVQHKRPVANQGGTQQQPQGTPSVFEESEDHQPYPGER
jgi:hypothetical protein